MKTVDLAGASKEGAVGEPLGNGDIFIDAPIGRWNE